MKPTRQIVLTVTWTEKDGTLTTNGSQLPKYADELADHGVKRINVSLETLDATQERR